MLIRERAHRYSTTAATAKTTHRATSQCVHTSTARHVIALP